MDTALTGPTYQDQRPRLQTSGLWGFISRALAAVLLAEGADSQELGRASCCQCLRSPAQGGGAPRRDI